MATPTKTTAKRAPRALTTKPKAVYEAITVSPTSVYEGVARQLNFDPSDPAHGQMLAWALNPNAIRRSITN